MAGAVATKMPKRPTEERDRGAVGSAHSTMRMRVAVLTGMVVLAGACSSPEGGAAAPYTPGLGEIMTLTQMRHAKLWLAAQAGNWALANYEVDELEEGFQDAVGVHPTHKDAPVSIAQAMPAMTAGPIAALRAAIAARDSDQFSQAFNALTDACNACHRATDFAFNVVTVPHASSFPNQDFSPPATGH